MPDEEFDLPGKFGSALRHARQLKNRSLLSLGNEISYSKSYLSKIENNKISVKLEFAQACDKALDAGGWLIGTFLADASRDEPPASALPGPAPFDVPPPPGHFTGRNAETTRIVGAIRGRKAGSRAPVVLIHGLPGSGKTALALHVAHLVRAWYPGGCLFADFGDGPGPRAVHSRLLRRLGVPASEIPAEPDEARALYLSVLYRQAVLVIADGVTRAGQVTALVPASSRCAVIATSRRRLDALDDGVPVPLGPLAPDDASDLIRAVSGRSDLGADADVRRMAAACGGLPLALRVAAVKARDPRRDAAQLAGLLQNPATAWQQLDDGERSVRRALEASVGALPGNSRQTLAALALHPAETAASHPVAWLAGRSPRAIDDDFAELAAHDLITVSTDGRARPHGLVRGLAPEAAGLDDPSRRKALRRLIAGYARTAMAADSAMVPLRFRPARPVRPREAEGDVATLSFGSLAQAVEWCRGEAELIPRLCSLALEQGLDEECWRLAYAMRDYFFAAKSFGPWVDSHRIALRGAEHHGDPWAQAVTRNNLGLAYVEQGRITEAEAQYAQALVLLRSLDDDHGIATTLGHQAWANHAAGRHDAAIALAGEAMELNRRHDNQRSLAIMCRTTALAHSSTGRHGEALNLLDECAKILSGIDSPLELAMLFNCLGEVHRAMGDLDEAITLHAQAAGYASACGAAGEQARAIRGQQVSGAGASAS